jgi:chaperonin cofactor prefoldin
MILSMPEDPFRKSQIAEFELEAELLVAHQLDLLAQIENQLRATQTMMRGIEKLRGVAKRVGPELTNGERLEVLATLTQELEGLDDQLLVQHQSTGDMQATLEKMRHRLLTVRRAAEKRLAEAHKAGLESNPQE